ncbi:MAG TPA: TonB-dependent receptor, partial [Bryobacteraceae bacterium]|nr:TonB-dependent receptor [Bryobacteraceae bacterium]
FAALALVEAPACAQTEVREHVTAYPPAYFAGNQPSSALDMINLLPGFSLVEGDTNVRGYSGAVGNVLIDGRPPASKQEKLEDILKRIPSGSVEQVELVRPGVAGIDMQGYALVANVVRKASNVPRSRLEAEYVQYDHGQVAPKLAGEISLGSTYVLNLQASVDRDYGVNMGPGSGGGGSGYGFKNRYKPDGSALLLDSYDHPRRTDEWLLTGTWRQPLFEGALRFNALFNEQRTIGIITEKDYYPVPALSGGGEREMRSASEFGIQYTHPLWSIAEVEVIGIRRGTDFHQTQSATSPTGELQAIKAAGTDETILRNVGRVHGGSWNIELGIEGALNGLNNRIAYRSNGVLIPLPSANVKVSEVRAEGFLTATWRVLPDLTLEAGARYETSQLKQQGDLSLTRKLSYLKPHALVTWNATEADEVRFLYERQAGQLDFNNFVSAVMLAQGNVSAGNPNLKPYTQWQRELTWEHRFATGSLVGILRDDRISNTVDRIMLDSAAGPLDAVGNIGSGNRQELAANFNFPLGWIDPLLEGYTVQGGWLERFSHVTDPTTGEIRQISLENDTEGKVNLTKDVPAAHMRWGLTFTEAAERRSFRFNELGRNHTGEMFDAFVEYKPAADWQFRLFAKNITNRPQTRIRNIFAGPRNLFPVQTYTEFNPQNLGTRIGINLQHTLGE